MARLRCDGGWLRDDAGRIVLLRGANVSGRSKFPPFLAVDDPAWFDRLADWGMNAVRLLVTWEAIEPTRGRYDDDYLAAVARLVRAAGGRGLHVVVDVHQDLYARSFGGDGAPAWAVRGSGRPVSGRAWFWHYTSRGVQDSFAAFWRDDDGLQTAFLDAVARMMSALEGAPAVVGYDLFNEPMAPLVEVLRGRFERGWLADFHRRCIGVRDRNAPGRLLFVEPTPLVAFGAPTTLPPLSGDDLVYAPHLYDATAILASRFVPRASTFPTALGRVCATARERSWPLCIGEFGILGGIAGAPALVEDQCARLDRAFASWMVWHFDPGGDDWNEEDASIVLPGGDERPWTAALVRPFPRALAGTPEFWDSADGQPWSLRYTADSDAPTEIVIPPRWSAAPQIDVDGADHALRDCVLVVHARPGAAVRVTLGR